MLASITRALVLSSALFACVVSSEPAQPAQNTLRNAPTAASTSTSSTSTFPSTTPQPIPPPVPTPQTDYREALGQYADLVLENGLVPYGSIEHLEFLASCIESSGFHVELDLEERSLAAQPGNEQESAYRQVLATCEEAAFSLELVKRPGPLSDEFLAAQYDAFMLTYECLSAGSYPVSPPPSKDLYVESGGTIWHPYDQLSPLSAPQIERECPQDLLVLFKALASRED